MLGIKKLDIYIIKSFLAYFFMTFFISVLILLMQVAWKEMPNLVGKGVEIPVLAEFFWYAALGTVPMALPLAILLAALMNFGNLGENFELTAMKSAGVSLWRIMRGLIIFIGVIVVGAFFFSNNVTPMAQQKLWTLIFSLRHKSPEIEIPVGEFYKEIRGYNLYVREKDPDRRLLKDLMIYDFSNGFENATINLADSGKLQFSEDKKHLKLTLFSGESFQNLRQQSSHYNSANIPYRREIFDKKEILIDFDTEFNRYDEDLLKDQHVSKNIVQLTQTIDSVSKIVKSRERGQAIEMISTQFPEVRRAFRDYPGMPTDSLNQQVTTEKRANPDSLFLALDYTQMQEATNIAKQNATGMKDKIEYNKIMLTDPTMTVRRHQIERHRKFTLSFACLIFFFIGAPLGAIIRKGGLGFPIVISVVLFVIYYIIDTTGYKMAREGFWQVYQGMWLSSAVLFPLGLFLTWKAVTDASIFRTENYIKMFENLKKKLIDYRRGLQNRKEKSLEIKQI